MSNIYLRLMEVSDTEKIVAWRNHDRVRRNFIYQQLFTPEGHMNWIRTQIEPGHVIQFIICETETDRAVGSVYFRDIDREKGCAEYGIFIGEDDAVGKGYGTQAAKEALRYAFESLRLQRVFLRVFADNVGARKSYENAGFRLIEGKQEEVTIEGVSRKVVFMECFGTECAQKTCAETEIKMSQLVSFVIPCYRSAQTIGKVIEEIETTMKGLEQYRYEIVLVNDCSPDDTFEVIRGICAEKKEVCGINLAKNFGQHAALMAGFHHVHGDIVVCLDDDGQTPADEVGKLLAKIEEGYDAVYARYAHKQHSGFRNFGSKINELMTRVMLGKPKELYLSSYFAARRFIIEEMIRYANPYPYVMGLVLRTTKKIANVDVNHREREIGASGYTIGKLLGLWFNGFTAFSIKPLRIATAIGVLTACAGFLYGIYTVIKKFVNPDVVIGFSSLMSAIVFLGGMMMLMLGIIGEYVGRIYISMNNSPQYVIRECIDERE